MKKQNRILFLLLIILSVAALVIYLRQSAFTIKKELRDFAIDDSSTVTKIFLADKTGKQVTLDKISPGDWLVNGKSKVRNDAVNMLLYTMLKLEVKNPVARAATDHVLKNMAANATKVEIYQNNSLTKTYYVGGATQDQLGTFMLLDNSTTPFVMFLPGLNGYLTTRYFTDEAQWKSRIVFKYKPDELKVVSIEYPDSASKSFTLTNLGKRNCTITSPVIKTTDVLIDSSASYYYLSSFSNIQYEIAVTEMTKQKRDSILASKPICILTTTDVSGHQKMLKFYGMSINEHSLTAEDENGPLKFDLDRMYALIDGKDLVIVQHFVFDRILWNYISFLQLAKKPV